MSQAAEKENMPKRWIALIGACDEISERPVEPSAGVGFSWAKGFLLARLPYTRHMGALYCARAPRGRMRKMISFKLITDWEWADFAAVLRRNGWREDDFRFLP